MFPRCMQFVRKLSVSALVRQQYSRQPFTMAQRENEMQLILNEIISSTNPTTVQNNSQQLCKMYMNLEPSGKYNFLKFLVEHYSVDVEIATAAAQNFLLSLDRGEAYRLRGQEKLQLTLMPPYTNVFSQIGKLQGGVKFLVDLRTDLLNLLSVVDRNDNSLHQLRMLNKDLQDMLSLWFSVGFLEVERVTWKSSCDILQKISEYEAVHPVRNWPDLKRRVGAYRRCYVFTHHSMPREPLVVLHTALTMEISSSIQSIVQYDQTDAMPTVKEEDPKKIHTAVFYSISSTQKGLKGIELGNQLIKRVVGEIQTEYPHINQFSTLSPIPGFKEWLVGEFVRAEKGSVSEQVLLTSGEVASLMRYLEISETNLLFEKLLRHVRHNSWTHDKKLTELLRAPLLRLCARYLFREKHRGYALNSVANFHLRNGSVLWRLNWLADITPRGLNTACGMMVNYRYFLEALEENSRRYIEEQRIEASDRVFTLLNSGLIHSSL